jgi:hypothetical protein
MNDWMVKIHALAEPELQALPADMRARFLHIAELLETFGPQKVGMPHIRPLEGKLWEMRMQGRMASPAPCMPPFMVARCWCCMYS